MTLLRLMERAERVSLPVRLLFLTFSLFSLNRISNFTSGFSDGPILCLFRNITGLPCPFCGTTRSIGNILIGEFSNAVSFNLAGFPVLLFYAISVTSPFVFQKINSNLSVYWFKLSLSQQIIYLMTAFGLLWTLNIPRMV